MSSIASNQRRPIHEENREAKPAKATGSGGPRAAPDVKTSRPQRRHVHIRCRLEFGSKELEAYTDNISTGGFHIRVPRTDFTCNVRAGRRLRVTLKLLSDSQPISAICEIAWIDYNDHDAAGRAVVGLGIHMIKVTTEVAAQVERFVENFRYTVLVVSPFTDERLVLESALKETYEVLGCSTIEEALGILDREEVGVLIADHTLSPQGGADFVSLIAARFPNAQTAKILVAPKEVCQAENFINVGRIFASVPKPFRPDEIIHIVRRALYAYALAVENNRLAAELERVNRRLQRENAFLRKRAVGSQGFDHIIGSSPKLRKALAELERIRQTEATVHIRGETGTGKELVARALHFGGPRAKHPFIAQNCGGMNESLLQSTLFGYKKGAFTGADEDRPGLFQAADRGTLFLDEIAELPPSIQAALLRAIQLKEVTPVGANKPTKVDVRIVSATLKDLRREIKAGHFREDLYFRLVVIEVSLPPLRERVGDIPVLSQHLLELYCERYGKNVPGFTPEVMEAFERHTWPGNVRELENNIERLVVLAEPQVKISLELVPTHIRASGESQDIDMFASYAGVPATSPVISDLLRREKSLSDIMNELERSILTETLERFDGNRSAVARHLKLARQTLQSRMKKLGL